MKSRPSDKFALLVGNLASQKIRISRMSLLLLPQNQMSSQWSLDFHSLSNPLQLVDHC